MIARGDIGELAIGGGLWGCYRLMHVHIHWMDTVSYLLGDPEIAAVRGDLLPRSIAVKDNRLEEDPQGLFQLVFANGIEAWSVPDGGREYEIVGTERHPPINVGWLQAVTFRKGDNTDGWPLQWEGEVFPEETPVSTVVTLLEDLVDAHESGRPSIGNIEVTHPITEGVHYCGGESSTGRPMD